MKISRAKPALKLLCNRKNMYIYMIYIQNSSKPLEIFNDEIRLRTLTEGL